MKFAFVLFSLFWIKHDAHSQIKEIMYGDSLYMYKTNNGNYYELKPEFRNGVVKIIFKKPYALDYSICRYQNGLLNGTKKYVFRDEKDVAYETYKNDTIINSVSFDTLENIISIALYGYKGLDTFSYKKLWSSEQYLLYEGTCKNENCRGLQKWYYPNGVIELMGNWVNDKKQGTWIYFDISGNRIKKEKYRNDRLIYSRMYKN